jgi:putative transcriptional regulator
VRKTAEVPPAPLPGRLLVATPRLTDPNFARTVVLLLAAGDGGALGIVVNRPGGLEVAEILPQWESLAAEPAAVFVGGPVAPDTAMCLGRFGESWRAISVDEDPATAGVESVRLFAAYAGWGQRQLEAEIEDGGWYVLPATADDVFTSDPETLWRRVLRRQPSRTAWASTAPDDPRQN